MHFIPFLLFAVFAQTFIVPASFKNSLAQGVLPITGIHPGFLIFISVKIQVIVYWILSWICLRQHEKNVKLFASATNTIDLWWLRYFLIGLAVMIFLWLNDSFLQIGIIANATPFGYLFVVYFMAYFSLKQGEIFPFDQQSVVEIKEIINGEKTKSLPRQSRLSDVEFEALKKNLKS